MQPATLSLAVAVTLARQFAPEVPPDTLLSFAYQESGLRPLSIHDNADGRAYLPETQVEAVALAERLILREGHRVDLGLLQVDFAPYSPSRDGLTIREAFSTGPNMRTGGAILVAAYKTCQTRVRGEEERLRCAAALYNAGSQNVSGRRYAARIWQTAANIVPSIGKILHADFPSAAPGTDATIADARPASTEDNPPAKPDVTPPDEGVHDLVHLHRVLLPPERNTP